MKQFISIAVLFLAAITTSTSKTLTITNESHQSFIIDYKENSGQQSCSLNSKKKIEIYPSSNEFTITLRNSERPDGRFSQKEINNHNQTTINTHGVYEIKIIAHHDVLFDQAICNFFIVKVETNRPDSGIRSECHSITSPQIFPSESLGMVTLMDYDLSSIREEKDCANHMIFQHYSDENSAAFE